MLIQNVHWPKKVKGYYVARMRKPGIITGYLTNQGGWSLRISKASMFRDADSAQLAGKLRTAFIMVLANMPDASI